MKNIAQFKGKKILILGLAKSGYAAAQLLHSLGAEVTVNDASNLDHNEDADSLMQEGVRVIGGGHPLDLLDDEFDLLIKNPGIPYTNPIIQKATGKNIPIWTEIELAYQISEAPIIGITGSNGKTTTTTLLYHMLNIGMKHPLIAGNIGTVSCTVAEEAKENNIIVLETSSFQLMGTEQFKPNISILLNLYDAHLDYHGDFSSYKEAKARITKNQTAEDYFIYNAEQEEVVDIANQSKAQKIPFSTKRILKEGISADSKAIYWKGESIIDRTTILLPGQHNLENILCSVATAILVGCDDRAIKDVLNSFAGVKHRMQFVREVNGVKYYNDSKATNTLATKSALEAFEQPIILIAGGLDRGHSFEELRPYMRHVKALIAIGETKERLKEFASSCHVATVKSATTMAEAVKLANALAKKEDVVLLSPASASWDEYPSFEDRGDHFIKAVSTI